MKKAVLCSVLFLLVGLLAGAGLLFATLTQGWLPNTQVTITTAALQLSQHRGHLFPGRRGSF